MGVWIAGWDGKDESDRGRMAEKVTKWWRNCSTESEAQKMENLKTVRSDGVGECRRGKVSQGECERGQAQFLTAMCSS